MPLWRAFQAKAPACRSFPVSNWLAIKVQFPERKTEAMKVNTYLNFPGNCLEAMKFYEKHLGAKILMKSTFAEMSASGAPQNMPPGLDRDGILHARFTLGDTTVMASDGPKVEPMRSAYLSLSVDSNEEAERIYSALSDGGEVFMKMGETILRASVWPVPRQVWRELDGHSRKADAGAKLIADPDSR